MKQEKKLVNILIVDDEVATKKLNQSANDHFGHYLDKGNYSFTVNVLDEKINSPGRLWRYLEDRSNTAPDFILLDWLFENEGDIITNDKYTGKVMLGKLMDKREKAFRNQLDDWENHLYQNMEVIALSSFIKTPPISNLEDMLLGGCIAAVSKDTFDFKDEEVNTKEKSFLLECIRKWYLFTKEGDYPSPGYDSNKFGELESNIKVLWLAYRQYIEGTREEEITIDEDKGKVALEESNYFVLFQKICEGESFDSIHNTHPHLDQGKSYIARKILRGKKYTNDEAMRTGEVHRWFHIALKKALEPNSHPRYQFIVEYLAKNGFYRR